ncbi:DNA/RNA non-specific endonuclease, partial [human gut metagenome]
ENKQETAGEGANLEAQGLEIPVSKVKVSETIKHRLAYTVSYNHDTRQPNWVAWALTGEHASGKLPRGKFADDEEMPAPVGTLADYYNSGFDRGHMCPAGDNKWSQQAMDECFLMTNMCPQNHSLNAGVWNTIEQQCRNWAKQYGKVYIVCGPIFLNKQHRKLGKNKVVVPDAFFKVVLHTGKNPQAVGFICRNQSQKGRKKTEFVNSVDEVERITGYDFFPQLPDDVEKRVEAKAEMF